MNFFSCKKCSKSADFSRVDAAAAHIWHSGGHQGANRGTQRHQPSQMRRTYVDPAARPVLPAGHFSGLCAKTAQSFAYRN